MILAIVGIYFWNTSRKQRVIGEEPDATPEDLLAELFRVHELSRAEQTPLATLLAKTDRLSQSALVFVEPGPIDRAIEAGDPESSRYQALAAEAIRLLELSGVPEAQTWDFPVRFSI